MTILIVLILLLALVLGGIGLLVEGLFWLLVIGLVLLVVSFFLGAVGRTSSRV
jgi:hypothetical protein